MPGKSSITRVIGIRLPIEAADKVARQAAKGGLTESEYIRRMVLRQVMRKR